MEDWSSQLLTFHSSFSFLVWWRLKQSLCNMKSCDSAKFAYYWILLKPSWKIFLPIGVDVHPNECTDEMTTEHVGIFRVHYSKSLCYVVVQSPRGSFLYCSFLSWWYFDNIFSCLSVMATHHHMETLCMTEGSFVETHTLNTLYQQYVSSLL